MILLSLFLIFLFLFEYSCFSVVLLLLFLLICKYVDLNGRCRRDATWTYSRTISSCIARRKSYVELRITESIKSSIENMDTQSDAYFGEDNFRGFNNEEIKKLWSFHEMQSSSSCSLSQSGKCFVSDSFKAKNTVSESWIIDLGAADHMTNFSNLFKS